MFPQRGSTKYHNNAPCDVISKSSSVKHQLDENNYSFKMLNFNCLQNFMLLLCQSLTTAYFINLVFFILTDNKTHEMVPVGDFRIVRNNETKEGEQVFVPWSERSIRWPNGRLGPPKDAPDCGFHGEYCLPTKDHGN